MSSSSEEYAGAKLPRDARSWRGKTKRSASLWHYAASLDGYEILGEGAFDFSSVARSIYEQRPDVLSLFSLLGLRVLLFMEYRSWRWADGWDGDETSEYVRAVAGEIKSRLRGATTGAGPVPSFT